MTFHFVAPMALSNRGFDTTSSPIIWYGMDYEDVTEYRATPDDHVYNELFAKYSGIFQDYRFYHDIDYFQRTLKLEYLDKFLDAVETRSPGLKEGSIILEPMYGSFEERGGSCLQWTFLPALVADLLYIFLLKSARYSRGELERQQVNKIERRWPRGF